MEIILLEQVKKLGNVGDVVTVKNGFARNFLIPNNKALRATKENIDYFEVRKTEIEAKNKDKEENANALASKLGGKYILVIRQAGEDGRLFGSVNSGDIVKALNDQEIERKQVVLHNPIKYVGIYEVEIDLYAGIIAGVFVNVSRSESEAKDAEKKYKKGEDVTLSSQEPNTAVSEDSDESTNSENPEDSASTEESSSNEGAEKKSA